MTVPTTQSFDTLTQVTDYLAGLDCDVIKLGTERVLAVLAVLGHPQNQVPAIHVAGTNGKGSVCAMLEQVYRQAGHKTGLFISPHLVAVTERIQLNGQPVSESLFVEMANTVRAAMEQAQRDADGALTYFEFINVMAFQLFAQQKLDVAIIETGLGGRLDSTNVIDRPLCTVITAIDYDHQDRLGETLTAIAGEKAGILRETVPVITPPQPAEAQAVIDVQAKALHVPVIRADANRFDVGPIFSDGQQAARQVSIAETGQSFLLGLLGRYQVSNLAVVWMVVETLQPKLPVKQQDLIEALRHVSWPGRLQYLPERQLILDGSHNRQGLAALVETLMLDFSGYEVDWGLSLLVNRRPEVLKMLAAYPLTHSVTPLQLDDPTGRFHSPDALRAALAESASDGPVFTEPMTPQAFCTMPVLPGRIRVITGSLYTLGDVLRSVTLQI